MAQKQVHDQWAVLIAGKDIVDEIITPQQLCYQGVLFDEVIKGEIDGHGCEGKQVFQTL